jgi:hypothetical protein
MFGGTPASTPPSGASFHPHCVARGRPPACLRSSHSYADAGRFPPLSTHASHAHACGCVAAPVHAQTTTTTTIVSVSCANLDRTRRHRRFPSVPVPLRSTLEPLRSALRSPTPPGVAPLPRPCKLRGGAACERCVVMAGSGVLSASNRAGSYGLFGAHSHATTEGRSTAAFGGPAAANSVNAFGGFSQHASSASPAASHTFLPAFSFGTATSTLAAPAAAAAPAVAPATDRFIFGPSPSAFPAAPRLRPQLEISPPSDLI